MKIITILFWQLFFVTTIHIIFVLFIFGVFQFRGAAEGYQDGGDTEGPHGTPQVQYQQEGAAWAPLPSRPRSPLANQKGKVLYTIITF